MLPEVLESRRLYAVDLSVAFPANPNKFPAALSVKKAISGTVKVDVKNVSTAGSTVAKTTKSLDVELVLRSSNGTETVVGKKTVRAQSLKVGKDDILTFSVKLKKGQLPAGTYTPIVRLDKTSVLTADTARTNNTATGTAITLTA